MLNSDNFDVCGHTRCRQETHLVHLGTPLCRKHWLEHIHRQEDEESKRQDVEDAAADRAAEAQDPEFEDHLRSGMGEW